jgi:nucleoside-triphosphatase THEP1
MRKYQVLSEAWIKASVIGTTWAAFEIVLGSFLHNLKVPFSGNILTALGLIILVSSSYKWPEKGLFWRSGLICAFMKSISPSAFIFGPMIAIFSEAVLLEMAVRILGRNMAGYLIGAMLAMSWNLFQKIINLVLFYGSNIIDLYTDILTYAQKQLRINFDIVWLPIVILLVSYALFGLLAAIAGMKIGRKILLQKDQVFTQEENSTPSNVKKSSPPDNNYSILWLFLNIVLMVGSLVLLNITGIVTGGLVITVIIVVWSVRYKRALRQLSKPKFWILLVFITMVTAIVFSVTRPDSFTLTQGIITGLQMNLRATILILGFTVLGTELYNPVVRDFFLRTRFKQLPLALELSFESLPFLVAHIPGFKSIVKNPVGIFYQVLSQTEYRLAEVRNKIKFTYRIFILSGQVGSGKTNCLKRIIEGLKERNIPAGGIISERILENDVTVGYDVIDISSGNRGKFLREKEIENGAIGRFGICEEGLMLGNKALRYAGTHSNDLIIIDEVGQLELRGEGWAESLSRLARSGNHHLLLSVNQRFVNEVVDKWGLHPVQILNIDTTDCDAIVQTVLQQTANF